jgi:hypothetical protein
MKKVILLAVAIISIFKIHANDVSLINTPIIKMMVLADKNTCWTCYKSIKSISQIELKNSRLQIQIMIASDDKSIIDNVKNLYKLESEIYLDPLGLYKKEYKFTNLPALVIYNSKGEIEIKEEWKNPKKYADIIRDLDEKDQSVKHLLIKGLKHIKTVGLIDDSNNIKKNTVNYFNGDINTNNEEYYISDQLNNRILVFDKNGKIIKNIGLPCDSLACNQPYRFKVYSNSLLAWVDFSKNGVEEFNSINTKTNKITAHIFYNKNANYSDSLLLSQKIFRLNHTKNYIAEFRYPQNINLNNNNYLLVLLDSNFKQIKAFGNSDSIFNKVAMARFVTGEIPIDIDSENNIYYITQLSKYVYKYNSEGILKNRTELDLDSSFKIEIKNYPSKETRDEIIDYRFKNSIVTKIKINNDNITVVYFNSYLVDNSKQVKYFVDRFTLDGKRQLKKPIELPCGWNPIAISDCKIVLYNDKRSDLIFNWYEFE